MAFLPGWDRERLLVAPPEDVAAARLVVFALEVKPILHRDYAGEIEDLKVRSPEQQKRHERRRHAQAEEALKDAWKLQVTLRKQLGLDDV